MSAADGRSVKQSLSGSQWLIVWGPTLAVPSVWALAVWVFEVIQLAGAKPAPSLVVRLLLTAPAAVLVLTAGALPALWMLAVRRIRLPDQAAKLTAGAVLLGASVCLVLGAGTYSLLSLADAFLVAWGTKVLFVSWGVAGLGVVALSSLWLGALRLRGLWTTALTERVFVTAGVVLAVGLLGLLALEPEVFVGVDGWAWLPAVGACFSGAAGFAWIPASAWLSRAVRILATSIAGAALGGAAFYGGAVASQVEQYTSLTRNVVGIAGDLVRSPSGLATAGGSGSCWPGKTPLAPTSLPPVGQRTHALAKYGAKANSARSQGRATPDILLVMVDGVRWDHTTMGGYKRDTMPNLARRAKDAALFTRSYTNSASTRQSFRSLLSGLLPSQVAPSRGKSKWALSFPKDQTTLAHYLSAAGAKTIAIQTNAVFLESGSRALAGFEVRDFTPAGAWKANRYSANYHVDRLIAHCSDFGEQQSRFVFSHMMEPHQPFRKGPGSKNYGKAPNDRYDSALRYVDTQLERVLSFALSPERRGNTYVIITSDHGMGVGDRNNLQQHGNSVYDDQVRVPLLIFGPKIKGRRIDTPVSLNDLFPTIVEMAGLPRLEHVCGQSLLAAAKGEAEPNADPVVVEIFPDHANPTFKLAMVIGDHKLVVDVRHDRRSLFDLKKDPKEGKDLVDTRPELLLELEEQLADWLRDRGRDPAGYGLIR